MYWATIIFFKEGTDKIEKVQIYDDSTGRFEMISTKDLISVKREMNIDIVNLNITNNNIELSCIPRERAFHKLHVRGYDLRGYAFLIEIVRDKYHLIIGDLNTLSTVDAYYNMIELLELFDIDKHKLLISNAMVAGNNKHGYYLDWLNNLLNDKIKEASKNDDINRVIRQSSMDAKADIAYRKEKGQLVIESLYHKGKGELVIPEGVNHIEKYNGGINHIILPRTLSSRGLSEDFAENASDLYKVTMPKNCGLRVIPDGCFQSSAIRDILGIENIKHIGHYAFSGSNLRGSIVTNNLTVIGEGAFSETYIKAFIAPNIEHIGKFAFQDCCKLESVVLGENLSIIPEGTFSGCNNLRTIEIPRSVKRIGSYAFSGCIRLREIRLSKNTKVGNNFVSRFTKVTMV